MNTMKRFGLTALCVVGMTFLASAPAMSKAGGGGVKYPKWVQLINTGVEPQASGEAILWAWKSAGVDKYGNSCWTAKVRIACHNLTPGATYYVTSVGLFIPDQNGEFSYSGTAGECGWGYPPLTVFRVNPDGSGTEVVLYV